MNHPDVLSGLDIANRGRIFVSITKIKQLPGPSVSATIGVSVFDLVGREDIVALAKTRIKAASRHRDNLFHIRRIASSKNNIADSSERQDALLTEVLQPEKVKVQLVISPSLRYGAFGSNKEEVVDQPRFLTAFKTVEVEETPIRGKVLRDSLSESDNYHYQKERLSKWFQMVISEKRTLEEETSSEITEGYALLQTDFYVLPENPPPRGSVGMVFRGSLLSRRARGASAWRQDLLFLGEDMVLPDALELPQLAGGPFGFAGVVTEDNLPVPVVHQPVTLFALVAPGIPPALSQEELLNLDRSCCRMRVTVFAEDMEVSPHWHKDFIYHGGEISHSLIFNLTPSEPGEKEVVVDFYRGLHWLGSIELSLNVYSDMDAVFDRRTQLLRWAK